MRTDDQSLIEAARRGELPAATELVDRHYAPLFAFLRRLSGSDDAGAELTQRTFTRVWPALDRFAGRSTLSSWLHGIAFHVYQVEARLRAAPAPAPPAFLRSALIAGIPVPVRCKAAHPVAAGPVWLRRPGRHSARPA
jgi:RNA polymerase sigma-70 factor (ECF subfamily)